MGNLTSDGTRTFGWDAVNRLASVTNGVGRMEFSYNGLGVRVRTAVLENGTVLTMKNTIWCDRNVCEQRDTSGQTIRREFSAGATVPSGVRLFAEDHLGSRTDALDGGGALVGRFAFDPWGRRSIVVGNGEEPEGFTGHGATVKQLGDKVAHCMAHCELQKGCGTPGRMDSLTFSYAKEIWDGVRGAAARLDRKVGIPYNPSLPLLDDASRFEWDDIRANREGRTCPKAPSCWDRCKGAQGQFNSGKYGIFNW